MIVLQPDNLEGREKKDPFEPNFLGQEKKLNKIIFFKKRKQNAENGMFKFIDKSKLRDWFRDRETDNMCG